MKHEKSAGVVVYHYNESEKKLYFLLLKYKTYWGFPKGMIEENEKEEETAIRELEEEAGIKAELVNGFQHKQAWFFKFNNELVRKEAIYFIAKVNKEEKDKTKISFEHEAFSWDSYEDAIKKLKIKANKEMLEKANNFIIEREKQKRLV